jgi:hypothetical protein
MRAQGRIERSSRRPPRRAYERAGFRPDRMALWAVLLGFLLVVVAATSSRAANQAHASATVHARVALHERAASRIHYAARSAR